MIERKDFKYYVLRIIELIILIIWVFPLIWMVLTSLHVENDLISKSFHFLPAHPTLANYTKAFTSTYILQWLINSIIISTSTMILTLVIDAPIAYAFAKIKFKGKNVLFWLVMAGMMVPFQVLIIPLYLQFNSYHLINTSLSVILPRVALPIGVFILKQFFEGIPNALEESAFLDGATRYKTFVSVILPLSTAALTTVTILSFINSWNDFLWPLIALNDTDKYTITVGIANFQGTHGTEYALLLSGAVIASIPQFIFYLFFRKKIVEGIAMAGLKG
jgi:multiple sugar transport system permease protein/raffinose/stachyose/melibiose transport system permease protein